MPTIFPEVNLTTRTLQNILRGKGIRKWRARKRPPLTPEIAEKRLAWAIARKDWTAADFEGVIWSDECSVEKGKTGRTVWVFRSAGEAYHPDCVQPQRATRDITVMVWGCFWGSHQGGFTALLEGRNNAATYQKILEEHLFRVRESMYQEGILDPVFQHDNSPVHTAKRIVAFLEKYGFDVTDHPPYSPDLNPIEHVWVELKRRLYQKYPDVLSTPGGPLAVKRRLAACLEDIWNEIPGSFFKSLYESMPRRVAAVIKANGWYTKY